MVAMGREKGEERPRSGRNGEREGEKSDHAVVTMKSVNRGRDDRREF